VGFLQTADDSMPFPGFALMSNLLDTTRTPEYAD
jgi:hypothetical protein